MARAELVSEELHDTRLARRLAVLGNVHAALIRAEGADEAELEGENIKSGKLTGKSGSTFQPPLPRPAADMEVP